MSIGTLYYSHSTARGKAEFQSMPFHSASITHNRDKASSMSFKSNLKLQEADRIIYQNLSNNKTFGGQVVKRSKTLGGDFSYEVMDYTRLYQSKVYCSFSNMTSSQILKKLLKQDLNNLSTAGIQNTSYIHSYLKWDNASLWTIIEQLAWLEYKAGNHIYYDIDYTGNLIWKSIPQTTEGYLFTEAYDYEDTHDSSDIITQGILVNTKKPSQKAIATASSDIIAKWGYVAEVTTCAPPSANTTPSSNANKCSNSSSTSYYSKCGLSPDKKTIVAVAKPSSADANKYGYRLYRTVFENYCPNCHRKGYLRFDGGKKTKCITSQKDGWGYKPSVQAEHEITCVKCDSDYCGVTGQEKSHGHVSRLKTVKKPVKSSQKEFNKLTSGKLPYKKATTSKCETKTVTSLKNDKNIAKWHIPKSVWQLAVSLTSPKKSEKQNAKAIFNWFASKVSYEGYYNLKYGPAGVIKHRRANCADSAKLFAYMCRSVGIKCNIIHDHGIHHYYNKVYLKGKGVIVDCGRKNDTWGSHWGGTSTPQEITDISS